MKRYLSFIILLIGVSCTTSHNLPKNDTNYDKVSMKSEENVLSNRSTVETEMETNKTMTDTLGQDRELGQGRTIGVHRLQFLLLPIMYKMGVMSTLLVMLVALSLKSLLIGVILLVIKVSSFLAKFHHVHHEPSWSPPSYVVPQPPPQPVYVHVHPDEHHHHPHDHDDHDHHHDDHDHHHDYVHVKEQAPDQMYPVFDNLPSSNPYEKTIAMDRHGQYVMFKG